MEILFRSKYYYFYIRNNHLRSAILWSAGGIDLSNVPHLDDAVVLYHYKNVDNGDMYPVFYEHNGRFITNGSEPYVITVYKVFVKDYTLPNLKLLEDGDIV